MSTELQEYSIDNQIDAIREFSEAKGLRVIKTYTDPGRSGLTLKSRPGLQRLLADVASGAANFTALLVYDVSRWGRFQDTDEAAAYEFQVRSAGIEVIYCVEQFDNTGGPVNALLKHMKRSMAADYSSDLSLRVSRGRKKIAALGYWASGLCPYGYERWAVAPDGRRMKLARGERRHSQQWRTVLVPGPPDAVRCVRRAYELFVVHRRSRVETARTLNAEGWRRADGRRWSSEALDTMFRSFTYSGEIVFNQTSSRLGKMTRNPESDWIRVPDAFPAIVSGSMVKRARARLFERRPSDLTDGEILDRMRELLREHGTLNHAMIRSDNGLPSPGHLRKRFGSAGVAMGMAGFKDDGRYLRLVEYRRKRALKTLQSGLLRLCLESIGSKPEPDAVRWRFRLSDYTVAVLPAFKHSEHGTLVWRAHVPRLWTDLFVVSRVPRDSDVPLDYRIVPRTRTQPGHLYFGSRARGRPIAPPVVTVDEVADQLAAVVNKLTARRSSAVANQTPKSP